jgi:hypothetical protein
VLEGDKWKKIVEEAKALGCRAKERERETQ